MSGSARLLSGCQIHAVRLSEKVLSALSGCRALSGAERAVRGFAVRLSDQGSVREGRAGGENGEGLSSRKGEKCEKLGTGAPHGAGREV